VLYSQSSRCRSACPAINARCRSSDGSRGLVAAPAGGDWSASWIPRPEVGQAVFRD